MLELEGVLQVLDALLVRNRFDISVTAPGAMCVLDWSDYGFSIEQRGWHLMQHEESSALAPATDEAAPQGVFPLDTPRIVFDSMG